MRIAPTLICLTLLGAALLCPRFAAAQEAGRWAVTTSDFETTRGRLVALGDDGVTIQPADETRQTLGRERFVRMDRGLAPAADGAGQDESFVLHLRNGDRLHGTATKLTDTALTFQTKLLGDVDVPLEQLVALTRPTAGDRPWREAQPPADEILLANGDRLGGYVSGIDLQRLSVTVDGGAETPVDWSAVRQIRFADPGLPPPEPAEKGWRVTTAAGSLFTSTDLAFADNRFRATCDGRPVELAEADVTAVEQAGGPVVWLSELYPALDEQTPYLSAGFPTRVNGLTEGSGRGFVVRSKSRLRFDVPPGYARFRVRYKLADDALRGDVSIRILFDDNAVHSVEHLKAGELPAPVDLPLDGARSIALEVGYGAGLDVQDEVEWVDPALVR